MSTVKRHMTYDGAAQDSCGSSVPHWAQAPGVQGHDWRFLISLNALAQCQFFFFSPLSLHNPYNTFFVARQPVCISVSSLN